jgi:hypothetical protein
MTLPTYDFAASAVKPRAGEHYVSETVNSKFLGQPRGVYLGYTPRVTAGSLTLTLAKDPVYGLSLARVKSSLENTNVDVISESDVALDFIGHNFTLNPTIYVKVHANSQLGQPTTAEVYTTTVAGATPTDQLICQITLSAGNLVVAADEPTNRSTPYAYSTAPLGYGFMADGAVEDLLAAVSVVSEVAAARVDLLGVNHPYGPIPPPYGLNDRVVADLLPGAIAGRLGLAYRVVRSQDYAIPSTTGTINVSSSFAKAGRTRPPLLTIPPDGSETAEGAVTDPADTDRNTCFIILPPKNERPIDVDRVIIYGRLQSSTQIISGTVTFNGTTAVTGVGTSFTTQINPGDIILAADGEYYVVAAAPAITNTTLSLTTTAPAGVLVGTSVRRRYDLIIKRRNASGVEIVSSIPGGSTIRFFFGAWFDQTKRVHDARLMMFEGGEEPPLLSSAVGLKGKALLVSSGALCGAIKIQQRGSQVGTSNKPAHSLNFFSAGASPGPAGVANIAATGPQGPLGLPGTMIGPLGPQGPIGTGFGNITSVSPDLGGYGRLFANSIVLFRPSPSFWTPGGTITTFSVTANAPIKYLHGGMSFWGGSQDSGLTTLAKGDQFNITNVFVSNANLTGNITLQGPDAGDINADASYALFLNMAG